MSVRKFALGAGKADAFMREGRFTFCVRFGRVVERGLILVAKEKCPPISITTRDVIATTNEFAAQCIEAMVVPNKTFRNGMRRANDGVRMFDELDPSERTTMDLDPIFDGVRL